VGAHSRWISRQLSEYGHEVIVADARKLRLIYQNPRKSDRIDATYLAKLVRLDKSLLAPIRHRGEVAQQHLALLRSRESLVKARTKLVNHARGLVKSFGFRLPQCSTDSFAHKVRTELPAQLRPALEPVLDTIQDLSVRIRSYEREIERLADEQYPETASMRQIKGVGALTALAFVLTLEDPGRFAKSREVGPCLGLVPKRDQSGDQDPQGHITKTGDAYVRRLLIGSAHYILGPFGQDSHLRNWGLHLAERGGKDAKKRAAVAVARKLAVLLHKLWASGQDYAPFYPQTAPSAEVKN
jgi:transposase